MARWVYALRFERRALRRAWSDAFPEGHLPRTLCRGLIEAAVLLGGFWIARPSMFSQELLVVFLALAGWLIAESTRFVWCWALAPARIFRDIESRERKLGDSRIRHQLIQKLEEQLGRQQAVLQIVIREDVNGNASRAVHETQRWIDQIRDLLKEAGRSGLISYLDEIQIDPTHPNVAVGKCAQTVDVILRMLREEPA